MAVVVIGLLFAANIKPQRVFDTRITLSAKDRRPYGALVAYEQLHYVFPHATIGMGKLSAEGLRQFYADTQQAGHLMLVISPRFMPEDEELEQMVQWVRKGNHLLIASSIFSDNVEEFLHMRFSYTNSFMMENPVDQDDTLQIGLNHLPFRGDTAFSYPGRRLQRSAIQFDSTFTYVLGTNDMHYPNLLRIDAGAGTILLQLAPLAFSNYFLLYGRNMRYYDQVLSVFPKDVRTVTWDNHYIHKLAQDTKDRSGMLSKLLKQPPLRSALLLTLLLLLLFVLLEVKRTQRVIPVIAPLANDSLDFVKTIGRLYHDKGDHQNLAHKMSLHFAEHVRQEFQLTMDLSRPETIVQLAERSGVDEKMLRRIATFNQFILDAPALSESQLVEYYHLLDTFYKTTE